VKQPTISGTLELTTNHGTGRDISQMGTASRNAGFSVPHVLSPGLCSSATFFSMSVTTPGGVELKKDLSAWNVFDWRSLLPTVPMRL